MSNITEERIERLLQRGLRNLWYPVVPSWRLGHAPLGITRLGENLVLWRDAAGEVHALEDRCPHRGARLSLGWNLGEHVACWYHGVEVNAAGTVVKVPAVSASKLEGRECVRRYPVKEIRGAVFVWFGDEAHPHPAPLEVPEQLTSGEYEAFLSTAAWNCNYRYVMDNTTDPMHGTYLHAQSHSMAVGDKQAEMRLTRTPTGFVFEKTGQRDVNLDWIEWGESGAMWIRLTTPYRKQAGPGGPFWIIGFTTPIDEHHVQVFFWRSRKVEGWQRDAWRFMYKNRLEGLHWQVLEQDRLLLENMAPGAREHERLYEHDLGVATLRRTLRQRAEEQLKELDDHQRRQTLGSITTTP
jgi:phenylpropionate dioxygenase-like ring-hydroxylating dioxygenase large terminal subunit